MSHKLGRSTSPRLAGIAALLITALAASGPAPTSAIAPRAGKAAAIAPNFASKGKGLIRLAYKAFDPLRTGAPSVPKNLRAVATEGKVAWWLVQLKYPIRKPARDAVLRLARRSAGYLPEATSVLEMTPEQAAKARRVAGVRWVGLVHPAYKLRPAARGYPGVLALKGRRNFRAFFHRGEDRERAIALMRGITGVTVDEAHATSRVVPFTARSAALPGVARLHAVRYVAERPVYVLHNYNARWASDTGERDSFWVTAPGHLTGAGQTAAAADTGINYVLDSGGNAQRAFADLTSSGATKLADYTQIVPGSAQEAMFARRYHATRHRKMAAYYDLGGDGFEPSEPTSHGTHVGGSIAADYPDASGRYGTHNARGAGEDGMAPGAHLVFQDVATGPDGGLGGLPPDQYDLWEQVYDANPKQNKETDPETHVHSSDLHLHSVHSYDPLVDARTHNSSFGPLYPVVDPFAESDAADGFVQDHEDFVIITSAGNDGEGLATHNGGQGISKNTLSSCASAGARQPMISLDSVAEFSGHGPTLDGRIKPDVCTPGQIIISPKGSTSWQDHYLQGTSMSSPVLTGLATLVRQYFWDGYGPKPATEAMTGIANGARSTARRWNPSAALVKAVLINSADRMRGWYSGDEGGERALDGQWPSAGQGWGRVELDNALAFTGEAQKLFVADVWNRSNQALDFSAAEYTIEATAGQPLEITVAWNDAVAAPFTVTTPLVNNLDLTVTAPDGTTYTGNNFASQSPFVLTGPPGTPDAAAESRTTPALPDVTNNVEAVRIEAPATGTYRIRIDGGVDSTNQIGTPGGAQGYSLVASGLIGTGAKAPVAAAETIKPVISDIAATPVSADLALVTWKTNERTTGAVLLTDSAGTTVRYDDVYSPSTWVGEETPVNEVSGEYADKKVLSTSHEVRLSGLKAGERYRFVIEAKDAAATPNATTSAAQTLTSADAIFQPDANDIADLQSGDSTSSAPLLGQQQLWGKSNQLYVGVSTTTASDPPIVGRVPAIPRIKYMPAFMFRLSGIDPSRITGAAVELTSAHNRSNHYQDDPRYILSLLDSSVEGGWGPGTSFGAVESAAVDAVADPQTGLRIGNQTPYTFPFSCGQLEALKANLAQDGSAQNLAFRLETDHDPDKVISESLFSFETGYGRRSRGPEHRPKLLLQIDGKDPRPCSATAAPVISDVKVQSAPVAKPTSVVVTWTTDVPSTSMVLFRKAGASAWTQTGSPFRSTQHLVQVEGLTPYGKYEFAVRSATCNGLETTDDNANKGYALFNEPYYAPVVDGVTAQPAATGGTAMIRWLTDTSADGVVEYGTSPTALTKSTREAVAEGESPARRTHEVELEGLEPCSVVYFRAVSANGAGSKGASKILSFQMPSKTLKDLAPVETFDVGLGEWTVRTATEALPPTEWAVVEGAARTTIAGVIPGYGSGTDTRLISPPMKTNGGLLEVSFTETFHSEGGFDFGSVEYSTDGGKLWHEVRAISGIGGNVDALGLATSGDGSTLPRDVAVTIAGVPAGTVRVAFRMASDSNTEVQPGWSVDNVVVREVVPCSPLVKPTATARFGLAKTFTRVPVTGPVPARAVRISQDVAAIRTDLNPASAAQRAAGSATCVRVLGSTITRFAPGPGTGARPLPATGVGSGLAGLLPLGAAVWATIWLRRRRT